MQLAYLPKGDSEELCVKRWNPLHLSFGQLIVLTFISSGPFLRIITLSCVALQATVFQIMCNFFCCAVTSLDFSPGCQQGCYLLKLPATTANKIDRYLYTCDYLVSTQKCCKTSSHFATAELLPEEAPFQAPRESTWRGYQMCSFARDFHNQYSLL